jgi:drug/metabolite transporter (DMT)-like permease
VNARQAAALVFLAAVWGASFIFIDVAVPAMGAIGMADSRALLAAAVLALYAVATRQAVRAAVPLRVVALVGAVNVAAPFALISAAQLTIPPSLAAIINAAAPLFSAAFAALWLAEPMTRRKGAGLALGLLGVTLVVGLSPVDLDATTLLAVAASTAAAASYAAGGHLHKRHFSATPAVTAAIVQQLAAGLLLTPLLLADPVNDAPDAGQLACIVALAIGASGVGYLIYFRLIAEVGATSAMTVTYLVPVFGVLWAALFRGDEITLGMLAGAAVVLAGIALVTGASSGDSAGPSDPAPPSPPGAFPPPPATTGGAAARS